MKLEKLVINGLFDRFNHTVVFHQQENINIIIAPNGYGKTVILKIVDSIFKLKLSYFLELEFNFIQLITDERSLHLQKDRESKLRKLKISIDENLDELFEYSSRSRGADNFAENVEMIMPFLDRVDIDKWHDGSSGEILSLDEILLKYSDLIPPKMQSDLTGNYPDWLKEFSDSFSTYFIQDQRLILRGTTERARYRSRKVEYTDTIEKYASDLADVIRNTVVESSKISQRLDSSFPVRLLKKDEFKILSVDELKTDLQDLQEKREKLSGYNLLASEDYVAGFKELDDIQETDTKVLTLYVLDTRKKLFVYDDILKRIELFSDILNNKRLSFKKVKIDSEKGFIFETNHGKPLKLTQLSSGEQHQIVLIYELIFNVKNNALVLIDEPEISLHVAWQKEFLNDLKMIVEIQDMSVIIATHSPQIIDNRWDLTIDLEEGAMA
jgi:predicted ATP-binding protein involved in virulence